MSWEGYDIEGKRSVAQINKWASFILIHYLWSIDFFSYIKMSESSLDENKSNGQTAVDPEQKMEEFRQNIRKSEVSWGWFYWFIVLERKIYIHFLYFVVIQSLITNLLNYLVYDMLVYPVEISFIFLSCYPSWVT